MYRRNHSTNCEFYLKQCMLNKCKVLTTNGEMRTTMNMKVTCVIICLKYSLSTIRGHSLAIYFTFRSAVFIFPQMVLKLNLPT